MSMTKSACATVVRTGEGQSVRWGPAGIARVVASADATDESFSIVEVTEPPGSAAPLHVHNGEAEAFYILDGTIELACGDRSLRSRATDDRGRANLAFAYAALGKRDAAFTLLEQVEWDVPSLIGLRADPLLRSLRSDPRYATLISDIMRSTHERTAQPRP